MKEFNFVNLNNLTWQLDVAIFGGVFSVFCLIYNDKYIYYGFATFLFGVSAHIIFLMLSYIMEKNKKFLPVHIANIALVIGWIILLLKIN